MSVNISFEGNLGSIRDGGVKTVEGGENGSFDVLEFSIPSPSKIQGKYSKDESMWYNVKVSGDYAHDVAAILKLGERQRVVVIGELVKQTTYERKDGTVGISNEVQAHQVGVSARFAANLSGSKNGGSQSAPQQAAPQVPADDEEPF